MDIHDKLGAKPPSCNSLRSYHVGRRLLIPMSVIYILIWIFIIAASIYTVNYENDYENFQCTYPSNLWKHAYHCEKTRIALLLVPIGVETIHLPIHITLYIKNLLHPIAALLLSICMMGMWIVMSALIPLVNYYSETDTSMAWEGLFWAQQVLGYILIVLYVVYMGYSAAALHKWRRSKTRIEDESDEKFAEMS